MFKLTALRQFDTVRLIPSRFAEREDSVLSPLAETDADLHDLFDLDNATSNRRRGETGCGGSDAASTVSGASIMLF